MQRKALLICRPVLMMLFHVIDLREEFHFWSDLWECHWQASDLDRRGLNFSNDFNFSGNVTGKPLTWRGKWTWLTFVHRAEKTQLSRAIPTLYIPPFICAKISHAFLNWRPVPSMALQGLDFQSKIIWTSKQQYMGNEFRKPHLAYEPSTTNLDVGYI